jgi:2OG-Fe(II) oxygenase superfamily
MMNTQLTAKKCYQSQANAFSLGYLDQLRQAILSSPYLGSNQLGEGFAQTKGFSIAFTRSGIPQVEATFPYLKPYLETVLKSACNAFYLNPLVLEGHSYVDPHVDCSLGIYPMKMINPRLVSILYVEVPTDLQGGQLVLQEEESEPWKITPQKNLLIHFLGWVLHSVTAVQSKNQRISLICEQYNLESEMLNKIPEFDIKSSNKAIIE